MTKYLVMKPHFSDDVCVDTPSAFVVQISAEFLDFLRILGENVAPFVERLKDFGFTKGEVNARFGDWMGLQEDRDEEEEKFWDETQAEYAVVDEVPTFFAEFDVETQTVSCDDPAYVNFKAALYDGSFEVYTDDVPLDILAEAVGYKFPKHTEKEYTGDATSCPVCGEKDIWSDNGEFDVSKDGREVTSPVYCKSCRSSWVDFYHIAGYRKLKQGDTQ